MHVQTIIWTRHLRACTKQKTGSEKLVTMFMRAFFGFQFDNFFTT